MSESNDSGGDGEAGMGIVRRRRSRRLLETRTTADKPDGARGTTNHAAEAWGGLLSEDGGLSDDALKGDEKPTRPYRTIDMPRPRRIIEPEPAESIEESIEQRLTRSTSKPPPKAQMRGVPLSNRPGAVAPPEEDARSARISEAPRKRISHEVAPVTPEPGPVSAPPVRPNPASARPTPLVGMPAVETPEPATQIEAPTKPGVDAPSEATRVVAMHRPPSPKRRRRTILMVGILAALFVAACVWSGAIIFDEMQRSARLKRVADALDTRMANILEENPTLIDWVKNRDAAQLKAVGEAHLPRLRETLTAAGYAEGVPKAQMRQDTVNGRLIVQVDLPDATLALNSDGDWENAPPRTGFGAALSANLTPIIVGFAVPVLFAFGMGVAARRRV